MAVELNKVLIVFLAYIFFGTITTAIANQGNSSSLSSCLKKSHQDSKKINTLSKQIVKAKSWEKIKKIMSVKNTKQFIAYIMCKIKKGSSVYIPAFYKTSSGTAIIVMFCQHIGNSAVSISVIR